MFQPLRTHRSVSIEHSVSSLLRVGAVALLAACGEANPVVPPNVPTSAPRGVDGNSTNAKTCQKNGWQSLVTSTGSSFASEDACVSYAAQGGVLYSKQSITFTTLVAKTIG